MSEFVRWMGVLLTLIQLLITTVAYEVQDTDDAMQYLSRFGYIGHDTASSMNIVDASEVLKEFQKMAGLNESGVLDSDTMKMMNTPRCGNKDMATEMIPDKDDVEDNLIRKKRYKLSETGQKWRKPVLTYRISKFSERMTVSPNLVEADVAKAFKLWEEATNLNFVPSRNAQVDIEIGFATAKHQDAFPFDGPGKTLAHAFSPGSGLGGDVHFDDTEHWTSNSPQGTNVLFVAVHEIGHSLGLSHSSVKGAIMQAFYGGYRPQLTLHPDDIAGVQSLYGKRESPTAGVRKSFAMPNMPAFAPVVTRLFPTLPPRYGSDSMRYIPSMETATVAASIPVVTESATIRTTTSTTKKPVTTTTRAPVTLPTRAPVTLPTRRLEPGSPGFRRPTLCDNSKIDAITTLKDGKIYVFKGYYVFQIDGLKGGAAQGWPKRLEFVFPGLEPNIDAAVTRENGKTYFFKGGKYFRFEGYKMDSNYPKAISKHFPGIPDYVDAAFVYPLNKHIYFTKGDKYWRFDPTATVHGKPHVSDVYPLPVAVWKLPVTGLDAALDDPSGSIYFFKDQEYWKFDTRRFQVAEGETKYPRLIRSHWFACDSDSTKSESRSVRSQSYM